MSDKSREKLWMGFLSSVIVIGTFGASYLVFAGEEMSKEKSALISFVLGYLFGLTKQVVSYYFGSSKGSSDKNEILKEAIDSSAASHRKVLLDKPPYLEERR